MRALVLRSPPIPFLRAGFHAPLSSARLPLSRRHWIPSRIHRFGPDFEKLARVAAVKSTPTLVLAAGEKPATNANALQEMRQRQAQEQIQANVRALAQGPPSSATPNVLASLGPSSQSTLSSAYPPLSQGSPPRSGSRASSVTSALYDLEGMTLEEVLATAATRALLKDYARSLMSEHLVDFLVALTPFHQPRPDQTTTPTSEPPPPTAIRAEDMSSLYDHFLGEWGREGVTGSTGLRGSVGHTQSVTGSPGLRGLRARVRGSGAQWWGGLRGRGLEASIGLAVWSAPMGQLSPGLLL